MPMSRTPSSVSDTSRARDPQASGVRRTPFGLFAARPAPRDPAAEASSSERMTWDAIRERRDLRGRWVALDACEYGDDGERPAAGVVVDVDDDLAELCARVRASNWKRCAIHFCHAD